MVYGHPGRGSGFPWILRRRRCTLARLSRRKFIPFPFLSHLVPMDVRPNPPLSPLSRYHPASISTTVAPSWSCVRCVRHTGPLRINPPPISRSVSCLFLFFLFFRLNRRLWNVRIVISTIRRLSLLREEIVFGCSKNLLKFVRIDGFGGRSGFSQTEGTSIGIDRHVSSAQKKVRKV